MKVEITTSHPKRRVDHRRVKSVIMKSSKGLLPSTSVISAAFLDDKEMTKVNETYTGRKGTTDVLSFPLGENFKDKKWHGEILISLDRAFRQAKEKKVSLIDEVTRLLVHSVVHLSGLDHYSKESFREMRRVELDLVLKCVSV